MSDTSNVNVLGVAGSLRVASYNRGLLRAATELAPAGMTIRIFDLTAIPLYNGDVEAKGDPAPVAEFKQAIRDSDALLFATPEYNFGVSGVLKNAVDWASRPPGKSSMTGKPAAMLGATPGMGGTIRSQMALRQSFVFIEIYAMLKPEVLIAKCQDKFDANGNLTDAATREYVRKFLDAFLIWSRRINSTRISVQE